MANPEEDKAVRMGQLIVQKLAGQLTASEEAELEQWLQESDENRLLYDELATGAHKEGYLAQLKKIDDQSVFEEIRHRHHTHPKRLAINWYKGIAAAALLLTSVAVLLYFSERKQATAPITGLIKPGGNRATLTLADGRTIHLDSASVGLLANQTGLKITKAADGQLIYEVAEEIKPTAGVLFNTITTPMGGQYQVILPDKSKVWLNAASSIRYPVPFNQAERTIQLDGEAYFEINQAEKNPFNVMAAGQLVRVLGTNFQISAYRGENIVTTLVQGSVQVVAGKASPILLEPGQQSLWSDGSPIRISKADTALALAWKSGKFVFDRQTVPEVMRQLARWYNLDIAYKGKLDDLILSGSVDRDADFSEVLHVIEFTQPVKFNINGRRVTVSE
ncbi:FecR family protein [bacterium A37T11]|nr:FecR family protein [bacterium A37T11]